MPVFSTILSGSQGLHLSGTLQHTGSILLDGEIQVGIDSAVASNIIDGSGNPAIQFDGLQNVSLPKAGAVSLTIGSDADGNDRSIVFGHSTLKSRIGIDDSADVFAINTDQNFEASNDLEIDASGNVTIGNGNLIIDGGEINGPATTNGSLKLYANGNVTVEIDSDNSGTDRHFIVSANNETPKLKVSEDGDIHATGVLLMSGSGVSRFDGPVIFEDDLTVDNNITLGSSNSDTLTLNATIAGNVDIEDRLRHVGDTDTQMRFPSDNKISFEAGGVAMQLWNGNSSPKENVFNESAQDIDFRIETNVGDNNQYTFLVDGSSGRIGMGYGDSNALETNSRLSVQGFVSIKDPESSDMMIQLTGSSDDAKIQLYSNNVLATEINAAGDSVFAGNIQVTGLNILNTEGENTITMDDNQRVGIGGVTPTYMLDVNGDIRVRGNDIRDNSGNAAITFDGTNADTTITGKANIQEGITHSPAVQVNSSNATINNAYINIAESIGVVQNLKTMTSTFLVSFTGLANTDARRVSQFLVQVNLTGKSSSPYYYDNSPALIVEPLNYTEFGGSPGAFDPSTDITLEYDTDFTSKVWMKSPAGYKNCFVTHLGGGAGDTVAASYSNSGWKIATGQSWAVSPTAGSRHTFTGVFADKQFTKVRTDTIETNGTDLTLDAAGDIILDAAGDDIYMKSNGSTTFTFNLDSNPSIAVSNVSTDFTIDAPSHLILDTGNTDGDPRVYFKSDGSEVFNFGCDATPYLGMTGNSKIDSSGTLELECTGDMTMDVSDNFIVDAELDITLDANGGNILFQDNGVTKIDFDLVSMDVEFQSGAEIDTLGNLFIDVNSSGDFIVYTAVNNAFRIDSDGSITASALDAAAGSHFLKYDTGTDEITYSSSTAKIKKDIEDQPLDYSPLISLRPRTFNWKSPKSPAGKVYGFIAEEVAEDFPAIACYGPDFDYDELGGIKMEEVEEEVEPGKLKVGTKRKKLSENLVPVNWDVTQLLAYHTKIIQDLHARIQALESE